MSEYIEPIVVPGKLVIPYHYHAGPVAAKFYREIKENRKIMGMKCSKCNIVLVPPRGTCGKCFSELDEWVELGPLGTLVNYTVVHYEDPCQPVSPPFAFGLIRLEGTENALLHLLGEVALDDIEKGMTMQPVFNEDPEGNILDIKYFAPVKKE